MASFAKGSSTVQSTTRTHGSSSVPSQVDPIAVESTPEQRIISRLINPSSEEENAETSKDPLQGEDIKREPRALRREFGVLGCISIIIGLTLGAGIFSSPQLPIQTTGSSGTSLLLWFLCGVIHLLSGLVYAEIGTAFPLSGGDASYLLIFYGRLGGTVYQFGANFFMTPAFISIYAALCAFYMLVSFGGEITEENVGDFRAAVTCFAIVIVIIVTAVCCTSSHLVNILATVHLFTKLAVAVMIVLLAFVYLVRHNFKFASGDEWAKVFIEPRLCFEWIPACTSQYGPYSNASGTVTINGSAVQKMFALVESSFVVTTSYLGYHSANKIVEELREPARTLPLGIFVSMTLLTVIYLLLNLSYMAVLTKDELVCAFRGAAYEMFLKVFGSDYQWIVPVLFAYSLFGTLILYLYTQASIPFVGGRNGNFPRFFALVHCRRLIPIPSLLLPSFIALLFLIFQLHWIPDLLQSAGYIEHLGNGFLMAGNIYWRIKRPDIIRPFKMPLAVNIIVCCFTWLLLLAPFFTMDWTFSAEAACIWFPVLFYMLGVFVIIAMIPAYWYFIHRQWSGTRVEIALIKAENRIAIFLQKTFLLVEEDLERESFKEVKTRISSLQNKNK